MPQAAHPDLWLELQTAIFRAAQQHSRIERRHIRVAFDDTVRVVDGRVYVNDVPMRDDFVPAEYRSHDDWGPEVVPEGYYFVMGDNRSNSFDSRHWRFVPKKYIIGKVQLRWWPVPAAKVF